jgi:hypothetical protein
MNRYARRLWPRSRLYFRVAKHTVRGVDVVAVEMDRLAHAHPGDRQEAD